MRQAPARVARIERATVQETETPPAARSGGKPDARDRPEALLALQRSAGNRAVGRLLQRALTTDECTAAQDTMIRDSDARAREMLENARTKLAGYDGSSPTDVRDALDRHFHSHSVAIATLVRVNLFNIGWESTDPQYQCMSTGTARGWSMWCVPFTDIELMPPWFADPDIDARARTMIHEWFHRFGCKLDLGYEWEDTYASTGTTRAVFNADSFAHFVYDIR